MQVNKLFHPLNTLKERNFRLVWLSTILAGSGQQMEVIVLAWFVLQLTNSPFLVGLITSALLGGTILGAFSGALADRLPRRLVLMSAQGITAALCAIMVGLIITSMLETWHIFTIAFLGGLARIFDQPARQALVADTVETESIFSGVALNIAARNLTMIAGPLLGGTLFALYGAGGSYSFMTGLYLIGVFVLFFIRTIPTRVDETESIWNTMSEGLKYVKHQQTIIAALLMAAIANLTAFPFLFTLLPIYARDTLGTESTGLGILMSATGFGALIGSLGLACIRSSRYAGKLLIATMIGWHCMTIVISQTQQFYLAFSFLILTGILQSMSMVLIATLLLEIAAPEYRGRVMGLRALAVYALPIGSAISGAMISNLGLETTALVNAVIGVTLILTLSIAIPRLRQSQDPSSQPAKS
jgi:MFS family permease